MVSTSETLYRSLVAVWRTLRSMRTALILLLVVAVASVFGSLVPQVGVARPAVVRLYLDHPLLARIYEALGLFDVYGSWWFTTCYVLLLISLASCLIPRTRALKRGLGLRPQPMRELEGMRNFTETTVPLAPDRVLERARSVLRRRRFRVAPVEPGLAAEKGLTRETGSLLFHWSLFLLLVGAVYGKGFGFTGQATVVEGETWTEAHAAYDLPPDEGRFFGESMHTGFRVRVEDFDAAYHPSGLPEQFVSQVTLLGDDGQELGPRTIRVNQPLEHEGVKLYQLGYGWAPVIEVRLEGRLLASEPVVFITRSPNDLAVPWHGVVKLPSLEPDVGLELRLFPDPVAGLAGAPMLEARDPFLFYDAWRGDLRLDRVQNVFTLDKTGLVRFGEGGGVGLGDTAILPGGVEVTFRDLLEYTQFLVKRDPGLGLMLAAALLTFAGLLPALYSSRRRVWVRAIPADGSGTRLQVAGFALQRRAAFEDEFRSIAGELAADR
ncbi:MAG: cytochrome c biogenesis protein ResB [Actinomycetota bacterium]